MVKVIKKKIQDQLNESWFPILNRLGSVCAAKKKL